MDRRLRPDDLRPDRRVNAVGANYSAPLGSAAEPSALSVSALTLPSEFSGSPSHACRAHRIRPGPLHQFLMQQHVEMAAVNRILRPVIAGEQPSRLRIDVITI